jgi:hypothetical protein
MPLCNLFVRSYLLCISQVGRVHLAVCAQQAQNQVGLTGVCANNWQIPNLPKFLDNAQSPLYAEPVRFDFSISLATANHEDPLEERFLSENGDLDLREVWHRKFRTFSEKENGYNWLGYLDIRWQHFRKRLPLWAHHLNESE